MKVKEMARTQLDCYNTALFNIGHTRRVNSPNETSIERQNCETIFEQKKQSLLSMANWGFAKTVTALSLTGYTPIGWEYEYYYPANCLRAIEISRSSKFDDKIPFQRAARYDSDTGKESAVIWTNQKDASLIHIRDIQNFDIFTPQFFDTLCAYMGIDLARVMAKQKQVVEDMKAQFSYHISEAVRMGEVEATDEPEMDANWIREAYGITE